MSTGILLLLGAGAFVLIARHGSRAARRTGRPNPFVRTAIFCAILFTLVGVLGFFVGLFS